MDNEITAEKLLIKKEKLSLNTEQIIEYDMNLADYYGDIVKILSCTANTNIFSSSVSGDKAVIDGCTDVKIIYIDSTGKLQLAECRIPWGKTTDIANIADNDLLKVSATATQLNYRAIDARRIEIHGSLTLHLAVYGVQECPYINNIPGDFCHTAKKSTSGKFLQRSITKQFNITGETENSEKYKNAKIIRCPTRPTVSEIKTIKNKMMIKGNVACLITYLTDTEEFKTENINVPINQIIESDAIDEDSVCTVTLKVQSIECRFTPDTAQNPPKAEINLILTAGIDIFKNADICTLTDAYSSKYEMICKKDTLKCITAIEQLRDTHTVTGKFDFSSSNALSICDAEIKQIKYAVTATNQGISIKGNIQYGIIIKTKDNEKLYFERISDFEYKKSAEKPDAVVDADIKIHCNALTTSADGNSDISITTELFIDGFVYTCANLPVITQIEKGNEITRNENRSVMTVYFAEKGEKLWNIAKTHGTSMQTIKTMNNLDCETLQKDTMLIFELE